LKFGIFVHPRRPKLPVDKIRDRIKSAGISYSQKDPDVAVVVGGDGTFGYYGRTLSIPLLFVGVQQSELLGSRARLAQINYNYLVRALHDIENGKYDVMEKRMLSAGLNNHYVDVLTDVYVERTRFAGCLRYETSIRTSSHGESLPFSDYAIGNGVIISTSFGAGGYFSYPDRLFGAKMRRTPLADFADDRIGICHIIPTYLVRKRKGVAHISHKIRYTVPFSSKIQIRLLRDAKGRLYGTTLHSKGLPVRLGDTVTVISSKQTAKVIKLRN
jgi:NAD+ kinase